jgi:hypothetical protein
LRSKTGVGRAPQGRGCRSISGQVRTVGPAHPAALRASTLPPLCGKRVEVLPYCTSFGPPERGGSFSCMMPSRRATSV